MTRGTTSLELYLTIGLHSRGQQRTAPSDNGEGGPVRLSLTLSGGFDEGYIRRLSLSRLATRHHHSLLILISAFSRFLIEQSIHYHYRCVKHSFQGSRPH